MLYSRQAKELADLLLPAFETESGIPTPRVNLKTGSRSGSKSVLAEIGTLQVSDDEGCSPARERAP